MIEGSENALLSLPKDSEKTVITILIESTLFNFFVRSNKRYDSL